jgi:hypothetical protein
MTDGQGPGVCCPKHKPNLVEYIKYRTIRLIELNRYGTKASVGGTVSQSTYVEQGDNDLDLF